MIDYHTNIAAPEALEQRECLRVCLVDVLGFLESGNHDCNSFDYRVIWLGLGKMCWRGTLGTDGAGDGTRIMQLVREARQWSQL